MGTIKFHCFIPEVLEKMPIVKSSQVSFDWVSRAREFYKEHQNLDSKTTKCPGIFSILGTGWIHRTYQDIMIETNGDGHSFSAATREDQIQLASGTHVGNYVSSHSPEQLQMFKPFTSETLASIIKIQSPWFVEIPDGYSLLMMPIPYPEDTRFTAATGLLRGNQFLNVQLYWHCLNSKEVIPAGTPLNQMILIKDDKTDYTLSNVENAKEFLEDKFSKGTWTFTPEFF